MLNQERDERKKRKNSMNNLDVTTEDPKLDDEEDRSKLMMHLYDDQEIKERKKE